MTYEEIYCMGRADYLYEFEGYSLFEGYDAAKRELKEFKNSDNEKGEK